MNVFKQGCFVICAHWKTLLTYFKLEIVKSYSLKNVVTDTIWIMLGSIKSWDTDIFSFCEVVMKLHVVMSLYKERTLFTSKGGNRRQVKYAAVLLAMRWGTANKIMPAWLWMRGGSRKLNVKLPKVIFQRKS